MPVWSNANVIILLREIFYQNPDLFQHQAVVDRYLNAIAFTFGVSRNDLNVVSS